MMTSLKDPRLWVLLFVFTAQIENSMVFFTYITLLPCYILPSLSLILPWIISILISSLPCFKLKYSITISLSLCMSISYITMFLSFITLDPFCDNHLDFDTTYEIIQIILQGIFSSAIGLATYCWIIKDKECHSYSEIDTQIQMNV